MEPIQTPINGNEKWADVKDKETKALVVFYKAFNTRDAKLMEQSWLTTDEVSMDNPIGGIRRGWNSILTGYNLIFNSDARVYVEFYDYTIHRSAGQFFATGRERGYFKLGENTVELAIRTTRIFANQNGFWKQIHHHGSIDNPELLKTYQEAIRRV